MSSNFLPPNKYVVSDRYLSNYNQGGDGLCVFVALLSQLNPYLTQQYYCDTNQLSSSTTNDTNKVYVCDFGDPFINNEYEADNELYNGEKVYKLDLGFAGKYIIFKKNSGEWVIANGDSVNDFYLIDHYVSNKNDSLTDATWRIMENGTLPIGSVSYTNTCASSSSSSDTYKSIQLSFWKFISCLKKYIDDSNFVGDGFLVGKKCDVTITLEQGPKNGQQFTFTDIIVAPSKSAINAQKLLQEIFQVNGQNIEIRQLAYVLNTNYDSISETPGKLPPMRNPDEYLSELPQYKKPTIFPKAKLLVSNIQDTDISFKDYIENYCQLKILNKPISLFLRDDAKGLDYETSKVIESILYDTNVPFRVVCNNILGESKNSIGSLTNDCFDHNDCVVDINLEEPIFPLNPILSEFVGYSENVIPHRLRNRINSIDQLKYVLTETQKPVVFQISHFFTDLLKNVDSIYARMNDNPSGDGALSDFISAISELIRQRDDRSLCLNERIYLTILVQSLDIIFNKMIKDNILKDTDTIDISEIDYLNNLKINITIDDRKNTIVGSFYNRCTEFTKIAYTATINGKPTEVTKSAPTSPKILEEGNHAIIIYGYENIDENKTILYCKNSWFGSKFTANKFKIIVDNKINMDPWDANEYMGKFGIMEYVKNENINFTISNSNLCDCCDLSSSSSSANLSSSSSSSSSNSSSSSSSIPEYGEVYACNFEDATSNDLYMYAGIFNEHSFYTTENAERVLYSDGSKWIIAVWDFEFGGEIKYSSPESSPVNSNWKIALSDSVSNGNTQTTACS